MTKEKAYQLWDPISDKISISRDVVFNKEQMGVDQLSDKPLSLLPDKEPEYVVDGIQDKQLNNEGDKEYLVKWKDYPDIDYTWEPYDNLKTLKPSIDGKIHPIQQWRRERDAGS